VKIPKQARKEGKRLFRFCLRDGLLDENRMRQVVAWILESRPRWYLPILAQVQRLVQLEEKRRSAVIESALPLEPGMQSSIRSSLENRYGAGLTFRFAQQPHLLGGVRVQVGSDVFDGTVRARLESVREAFDSDE
jgi:F-type H+-transporting ATPase subunit delta